MENCGSAVVSVISFFGASLLPLEITNRGFQEDERILEPAQTSIAVIAKETTHGSGVVIVIHGQLAFVAEATAMAFRTTTNRTAPVLFFQQSFIVGASKPLSCQTNCLVFKSQASTAYVLAATFQTRKFVNRFPRLAALAHRNPVRGILVARVMKPSADQMQTHGLIIFPRALGNLTNRKTSLKESDDPVHVYYLKRKQPDSLVAN